MDERLDSLLKALPSFPERMDSEYEQITDLVAIAVKLGMVDAADYLNKKLEFSRKLYSPKPLHPEQRSGEIHLLNSKPDTVRFIGWKSKRAGDVAYDDDGNLVSGEVPVFVQAEELAKKGQLNERYTVAP